MKAVISGYGKMGKMVEAVLKQKDIQCSGISEDIANFPHDKACESICIDFTTPAAFHQNYKYIADNFKGAVIGTTGWDDIKEEVIEYFKSHNCTLIYASNFSIGVNLFYATLDFLSKKIKEVGQYSPYMIEMHHCHKLDAPSGTAKSAAKIIEDNMDCDVDIQSVRCGEIPGIHIVGFESEVDRIVLKHEAFSRMGFALGAVEAAILADKMEGVHDFKDIIFNQ